MTAHGSDREVEAAPAPVIRMIGSTGGVCLGDSCSLESFIDDDPA
ncbi:hypothetical protein [Agreia sp. COWG]|nr:hypothetical protein [Agreia sp. COWG]